MSTVAANETPQVELLQRDVKILFDENRDLKEKVEYYKEKYKQERKKRIRAEEIANAAGNWF